MWTLGQIAHLARSTSHASAQTGVDLGLTLMDACANIIDSLGNLEQMQPVFRSSGRGRWLKRLELLWEMLLWRFRLIAIVPVVMSLASTLLTFALGTRDIVKSIRFFFFAPETEKAANTALASMVSGIDFYLIGVALLIFGYGLYELLISEIDVYRSQSDTDDSGGLLDIRNLDQLKEKLVKVLVVALIVSAFKSMISLPVTDVNTLLSFCVCVLLLSLSGFLIAIKTPKVMKK